MRIMISFAALFLSVLFVQLGSGSLGPLDALAGAADGFSSRQIGLLGSAHFSGFFIGCWITPRLLGGVGHSRAFAAVASIGAIAALLHPVLRDPIAWAILRIGTGFAVAGAYTIIESWMQAKVDNANRGRVLSVYRIIELLSQIAAQGIVAALDPASYVAYNIIAVLCCLCVLPLTLTKSAPPVAVSAPRLRPLWAMRLSPLGAAGVIVVGVTNSSFRMVGPVYALQSGLAAAEVAFFMAAGVAGGALAQWPAGWLSDRFDRRHVLIGVSVAAMAVCLGVVTLGGGGARAAYLSAFAFGAAALPLYSIAAAHVNDFADPSEMVDLNAALVFLYGVGAIISPYFASDLMERFGPSSLFLYVSAAHLFLIVFGLWRMTRRAPARHKTPHRYIPRTSFTLGRFFRPRR